MSTVNFTYDPTRQLYQGRREWLNAVCTKFGPKFASCCADIVSLEVETMDQLEEKTGMTIDQVLAEARR